jgi:hypothetical protein
MRFRILPLSFMLLLIAELNPATAGVLSFFS